MKYLNTLILEENEEPIKTDDISTPLNSNSTKYEAILVNKPVPWYGHARTNSSDEPVVFPARQTYTAIGMEPDNVFLEIWVEGKNLFNISLNTSPFEEDKNDDEDYFVLSQKNGELHDTEGEDYIDGITENLEFLASKLLENKDAKEIWSFPLVDSPAGCSIHFVLEDKKILLKMLFFEQEIMIEEFDTYEKILAYISLLNRAKEESM